MFYTPLWPKALDSKLVESRLNMLQTASTILTFLQGGNLSLVSMTLCTATILLEFREWLMHLVLAAIYSVVKIGTEER